MYGKRLFRKNSNLHVEFKYRSRLKQLVVSRVRLKVEKETVSAIDGAIREWLVEKKSIKRSAPAVAAISTLFHRAIDVEVRQMSFEKELNSKKKNSSRHAEPPSKRKPPITTVTLQKLQRARSANRYREQKREQRREEKLKEQAKVYLHVQYVNVHLHKPVTAHRLLTRCPDIVPLCVNMLLKFCRRQSVITSNSTTLCGDVVSATLIHYCTLLMKTFHLQQRHGMMSD